MANQALANAITNGSLRSRLDARLEQLKDAKNAILLVTDLEALHPYTRIGAIESQLYGKFYVPTVFL
jgi:fatty acid-binding protein DegV